MLWNFPVLWVKTCQFASKEQCLKWQKKTTKRPFQEDFSVTPNVHTYILSPQRSLPEVSKDPWYPHYRSPKWTKLTNRIPESQKNSPPAFGWLSLLFASARRGFQRFFCLFKFQIDMALYKFFREPFFDKTCNNSWKRHIKNKITSCLNIF